MVKGKLIYFPVLLSLVGILLYSCLPEGEYKESVNYEPKDIADGWQISTAAAQGFNTDRLNDLYGIIFSEDNYLTSRSLLIVRNGKLVSESYLRDRDDINRKGNIRGITKSITSLLLGFAWDKKLFDPGDRLYRYIPEFFDGDINKRDITVENVLNMTSGLAWDNEQHTINLFNINRFPSTIRLVLTKPFLSAAGTLFHYNHGAPQLALGVLRKGFNISETDSVVNKLFDHLGITDFVWEKHTDGLHIGGLGLHMRPRDIARIGQFCLQKGWWDGEQIVSAQWIDVTTKKNIDREKTGTLFHYGYYWWIHEENNAILSMGDGGQYLYIVPGKDLVIVHTANSSVGNGYEGISLEDFLALVNIVLAALE